MILSNQYRTRAILWAFLLTLFTRIAAAEAPIVPPQGGQEVLSFQQGDAIEFRKANVEASADWVPITDMPFQTAYRVESDTRYSDPKNMRVIVPIKEAFKKGDVMLLSFWMRRPGAGGQPNNASFFVEVEADKPTFEYKLSAYRQWTQHVRSFTATADCNLQQSNINIHLGQAGKVAEIASLRLINYGADYDIESLPRSTIHYQGREPDAKWRQEALARIEKIRKANMTIEVVDADGKPIQDAIVRVQMQRHAFGFGTAVNSQLLGGEQDAFPYTKNRGGVQKTSSWQDAQKYREIVKRYFNSVTFESELRPHVWKKLRGNSPDGKREQNVFSQQTVPWLQANNIDVRGHYIAWAPMDFNALEKQFVGNPEGHRQWLWEHMTDVLPETADYVTEWDTINHIVGWGKHTYEVEYGGPEIYAEILAEARRLAPDATHAINEGKVLPDGYKREPYKRIIRFLNEQGQAPDTVGFMAHFGLTTLTPPEELLEVYDEFAEIAPRMQLSEFDVDAGDDDQLHADYYRDVMIASFSHPGFVAIIQWGFWENAHWKPAAALWREDWTLKPAGKVFVDLVRKQWWTDEHTRTNESGKGELRGFLGEYEIHVHHDGKTKMLKTSLGPDGIQMRLQLN